MVRGATIGIALYGDATGVLRMLHHLDTCFSPIGMTAFLGGDVSPWLQRRARSRFGGQGDDASGAWAPLRPATVEIRGHGINRGEWPGISPSHPINKRTGLMEDYITGNIGDIVASTGGSALYFPKRNASVKQGLQKKLKRAQLGDSRTVRRPVLAVNETDLTEVVMKLAYFIQRGPNASA